jgi:RND superfamily putative drug exporter
MFGLGLAGAVLLDAMIVRMALVPALMLVLGKLNWALPGWLDRILPHLNVEGSVQEPDAAEHHHLPHAHLHPPLRPQSAES